MPSALPASAVPLSLPAILGLLILAGQAILLMVLTVRLLPGRKRRPPVIPAQDGAPPGSVSVIVATLNEAHRIGPCLEGLMAQGPALREVLVVDSRSTDGTGALVEAAARRDPRIRLITDDPLPPGWVGKVWALETGLREAHGEWVLGIDADTVPAPGLVGGVVAAVTRDGFDVASFSPRFEGQGPGERWVQPAMLLTLVYRCGAVGATQPPPDRVLANGQCFLAKRALLLQHGGYAPARASFCDDVTLARHLAQCGARVGFLDGSALYRVRSYASLPEMWREWGRSFDLKDATPVWRRWLDVMLVWSTQALPVPMLLGVGIAARAYLVPGQATPGQIALVGLLAVNAVALGMRLMMLWALRGSYTVRGLPYWCSWLADIPAAVRLTISTVRTPRRWRGRNYTALAPSA